uniref:Uncharacterized protein n=1 Tax=Arundo donax TaxID=35708 RepID=A0A0A9B688_ARUDO
MSSACHAPRLHSNTQWALPPATATRRSPRSWMF